MKPAFVSILCLDGSVWQVNALINASSHRSVPVSAIGQPGDVVELAND